jgi:hypothetical protein
MKPLSTIVFGPSWFNTVLKVAAVAVWVLAIVMLVWNLGPFPAPDQLAPTPQLIANVLLAILAVLALPGALILWITMLVYWGGGDPSPKWEKRLWFLLILFGFCYGASIYFWSRSSSLNSLSRP